MSYSVYVHKFRQGEPAFAPFGDVVSILARYGSVDAVEDRLEFTPDGDDLCEIGFLGGNEDSGIDSVGFNRAVSSDRLRALIFELLGVDGMCYFEDGMDCVIARTDVTLDVPPDLLENCGTSAVKVIRSADDVSL
jgi:hypothetical protein